MLIGEGPSSPPSLGQLNAAIEEPSMASPPYNLLGGRVKDSMEKKGDQTSSQGVIKQASLSPKNLGRKKIAPLVAVL